MSTLRSKIKTAAFGMMAVTISVSTLAFAGAGSESQEYQLDGDVYRKIENFQPLLCSGAPATCHYLIDDNRNEIPADEEGLVVSPQGTQAYMGN